MPKVTQLSNGRASTNTTVTLIRLIKGFFFQDKKENEHEIV